MDNFVLTESQLRAVDAFESYVNGRGQVFVLKGAAGTGKTTLVCEFLKVLQRHDVPVKLMAPTGRAAAVLARKTGYEATTIHKGIYMQSSDDVPIDEEAESEMVTRFALRPNKDSRQTVYVVDEASMVSDKSSTEEVLRFGSGCLLSDLFAYADGRKVVFVGDYAQLPPVGMNISPALDCEYLKTKFCCGVEEVKLNEVMRQSGASMILHNATLIRQRIEQKRFVEFGIVNGSDTTAVRDSLLTPYYELDSSSPAAAAAVIAYTNHQVLNYNTNIRRHYYGENAPRLVEGERLMVVRNNYAQGAMLLNGTMVTVESCATDSEVELRRVNVKVGKDRTESVELRFRDAVISVQDGDESRPIRVKLLDNFLESPKATIDVRMAQAFAVMFKMYLPADLKGQLRTIQALLRSKSIRTEQEQRLVDRYLEYLRTDPYYNAVVCKYGYAMTCHKAQGGEWDYVLVDMGRYCGTQCEDYFRWSYTAVTRAAKHLWHYRSPECDYISAMRVEPIQLSANLNVSVYDAGDADFCQRRFARIQQLCSAADITATDDRSKAYQHIISFSRNGEQATFQLWYKAKGYSGKQAVLGSSGAEFVAQCEQILAVSELPDDVPFNAPGRPFAEKLVQHVKELLKELDIQLLNITQEQYQDVFHLKTDGRAKLLFSYTGSGKYTYMKLLSSQGEADSKLSALRQRFI